MNNDILHKISLLQKLAKKHGETLNKSVAKKKAKLDEKYKLDKEKLTNQFTQKDEKLEKKIEVLKQKLTTQSCGQEFENMKDDVQRLQKEKGELKKKFEKDK